MGRGCGGGLLLFRLANFPLHFRPGCGKIQVYTCSRLLHKKRSPGDGILRGFFIVPPPGQPQPDRNQPLEVSP